MNQCDFLTVQSIAETNLINEEGIDSLINSARVAFRKACQCVATVEDSSGFRRMSNEDDDDDDAIDALRRRPITTSAPETCTIKKLETKCKTLPALSRTTVQSNSIKHQGISIHVKMF